VSSAAPAPATLEFCALLARGDVQWPALRMTPQEFLHACAEHDVHGLMHLRIGRLSDRDEWPRDIRDALAEHVHRETAREMLRAEEISNVLAALAAAGVDPVLIKGTALAYSVYESPVCRPRADTDMLIRAGDVDAARTVLAGRGYATTVYCSDLFSQFEVQKTDRFNLTHVFDVHWKISTQPVFETLLAYDELRARSRPVDALGPHARGAGPVDALLLACVHPVMHHHNVERVLWIDDINRLVSALGPGEFGELVRLARERQVASICAHSLRLAHTMFGTTLPAELIDSLSRPEGAEPSAEYLASQRRWHHELASSVRGLPRFGDRVKLLRGVLLPSPSYMLAAYGLRGKPLAPWLLPALYVHRNVRGVWRVLTGKK
jgi:hypothetical protein